MRPRVINLILFTKNVTQKNKVLVLLSLPFFVCFMVIPYYSFAPGYNFVYSFENTTCHYFWEEDALPRVNGSFTPDASAIFFHETSCSGALSSRQACAVESAARCHPQRQIHLLFAGPVSEKALHTGGLAVVNAITNVHISRVNLVNYARGTPLEKMVCTGALYRSQWRISHTSDMLRYLSLYKWGGVYLDLDVLVVKSFDGLPANWAARESNVAVAAGALAFSRDPIGRHVAETAIRDFKDNFRGDVWSHNGPGVITRTLRKLCSTNNLKSMSAKKCKGFEVFGPELFYPVSWYKAMDYFSAGELKVGDPFMHHVWNKLTKDYVVNKNSSYAKLAQKHCPTVYESYGDKFGF